MHCFIVNRVIFQFFRIFFFLLIFLSCFLKKKQLSSRISHEKDLITLLIMHCDALKMILQSNQITLKSNNEARFTTLPMTHNKNTALITSSPILQLLTLLNHDGTVGWLMPLQSSYWWCQCNQQNPLGRNLTPTPG